MKDRVVFLIFGILQSTTLGIIIFLLFRGLNNIGSGRIIDLSTQILLSILFPLFLLLVEYVIFSKN